MVNIENILALRDFIASEEYKFDMNDAFYRLKCKSAGCIGGHAALLWPEISEYKIANRSEDIKTWDDRGLKTKLGITSDQHYNLCYSIEGIHLSCVKREHVLETLTHLAETGKIVWNVPRTS